ncbi:MAG: YiiD C-terminal domain-containing protein, partial [Sphingobium sp.]
MRSNAASQGCSRFSQGQMREARRMDRDSLQAYLHRQIPLSAAMQVSVQSAALESVTLSAPLEPNINHKSTAFGGS